jgi:hypothetical protein
MYYQTCLRLQLYIINIHIDILEHVSAWRIFKQKYKEKINFASTQFIDCLCLQENISIWNIQILNMRSL